MNEDFTKYNPEIYYDANNESYFYKSNNCPVKSKYLKVIKLLNIPKVYTTIWLSKDLKNNLLAVALDVKDKKQYYYSKDHVSSRKDKKLEMVYRLSKQLTKFKKINDRNMETKEHTKIKTMAFMIKTIELTNIRIGNKKYLDKNNSFGLTTLQKQHISIKNKDMMDISFNGKHSVHQNLSISCPKVISFYKYMISLPEDWIFKYPSNGKYFMISAQDLNQYLQSIIGKDFTCKDFRTHGANVIFLKTLQKLDTPENESHSKKNVFKAIAETASKLGNNKATSKNSYISDFITLEYNKNPEFVKKSSLEKILKLATQGQL
jgi:DNA topoisomerase-1